MPHPIEIVVLATIILTTLVSYQGFGEPSFRDRLAFGVEPILARHQYYRLLTAGLVHGHWGHLAFNVGALYCFCYGLGQPLGAPRFLGLYLASLVGGYLLTLLAHRHRPDYVAMGASGAVGGVILASAGLFPDAQLSFPFLPGGVPAWLFVGGFLLISPYLFRMPSGRAAHAPTVGGAAGGALAAVLLELPLTIPHPWALAGLLVPGCLVALLLVQRLRWLGVVRRPGPPTPRPLRANVIENAGRRRLFTGQKNAPSDEELLNRLLEKVGTDGMESLTPRELAQLEDIAKKLS